MQFLWMYQDDGLYSSHLTNILPAVIYWTLPEAILDWTVIYYVDESLV